jgi:3-oxoacyl-[acyl-carrier protein] reductase
MTIDFEGAVVLVTGAGHGLGRAIAVTFAERGAVVWGCGIDVEGLAETARQMGPSGRIRSTDVTDPIAVADLVGAIEDRDGAVGILVNNAGGVVGRRGQPIESVTDDDWHAVVSVNLTGSFNCARAVAPAMKRAGRGSIVNISSGAGLGVSLTGIQAYASAKAGQIGLTRQLAHELGPAGIRVNAVAPGFVLSNPDTERQWERYGEVGQRALIDGIHLRRLGTPADIAHAVLFLASDYASWITGQVVSVNGGR